MTSENVRTPPANVSDGAREKAAVPEGARKSAQDDLTLPPSEMSEDLSYSAVPMSDLARDALAWSNDPTGRVSDERVARLLGDLTIRTELRWSVELVKARLREAAQCIEKIVGRVGPSQKSTMWPTHAVEFSDQLGMLDTGELARLHAQQNRAVMSASEREITRTEEAIGWPGRYLRADGLTDERKALQIWMWTEAKDQPWERFIHALGCSKAEANRRRREAFRIIMTGLLKDKVVP